MNQQASKKEQVQGQKRERPKRRKFQSRFYLDLSKDRATFDLAAKILEEANRKDWGNEVTFKDVVVHALAKLGPKDVAKLREKSLSEMEKVERALAEYNRSRGVRLSMGEFLAKKLKLS